MVTRLSRICDGCGRDMTTPSPENRHLECSIGQGGFWEDEKPMLPHAYEEINLDFCSEGCVFTYIEQNLMVKAGNMASAAAREIKEKMEDIPS